MALGSAEQYHLYELNEERELSLMYRSKEHKSLLYGLDFEEQADSIKIAGVSFYDNLLTLTELNKSN